MFDHFYWQFSSNGFSVLYSLIYFSNSACDGVFLFHKMTCFAIKLQLLLLYCSQQSIIIKIACFEVCFAHGL